MHDQRESRTLSARRVAVDVLNQVDPTRQVVHAILARNLDRTDQRQRCTDLVLGVVRTRRTLDFVIERFGSRPVERIARPLVNVIRLAVFELVYCPLTPPHAIVHEAVEGVKGLGGGRPAGFVNAVLREVTRHIMDRQGRLVKADSRWIIPIDTEQGCLFDAAFLPDPKAMPHEYLAVCYSLPVWLVQDWISRFGYPAAWEVALASDRRPGVYLRPNPLKTTPLDLMVRLREAGIEAEAGEGGSIRLSSAGAVEQIPGYSKGLFSVQDPTAASVVDHLRPAPAESILDLCSAPGGKTIHIAEQTGDQARIVATDSNPERLDKVRENVARIGLQGVTILPHGEIQGYVDGHGPFDAVLLDVPCSNTGVLARRVEVRYRLRPQAVQGFTRTQADLLERAASWVKSEGRIIYSTCSILQPENEGVVQAFLSLNPEFRLESQRLTLPSAGPMDHDGGYVAILIRSDRAAVIPISLKTGSKSSSTDPGSQIGSVVCRMLGTSAAPSSAAALSRHGRIHQETPRPILESPAAVFFLKGLDAFVAGQK